MTRIHSTVDFATNALRVKDGDVFNCSSKKTTYMECDPDILKDVDR